MTRAWLVVGVGLVVLAPAPGFPGLVIEHDPVACVMARSLPRIGACLDGGPASRAQVHFRAAPSDPWYAVDLTPDGPCLSAVLPKPTGTQTEIEYYIHALDASSEARLPATAPTQAFRVRVVERADQCIGQPAAFVTTRAPGTITLAQGTAGRAAPFTGFARDEVTTTFELAPLAPAPLPPRRASRVEPRTAAPPIEAPPGALPACYLQNVTGASRFSDPSYFSLLLADGLRSAPPRVLQERTKAAADAGEVYKALFLARVLCEVSPHTPGVWLNRAALAEALGLSREALASRQRAQNTSATLPPLEILPGSGTRRPKSLADWAAALSLMADGMEAAEGRRGLVAVKDSVSGVEPVRTSLPTGEQSTWAQAVPIKLDDVVPNAFALRDAKAMEQKGTNWGALAFGTALAVGASVANVRTAAQLEAMSHVSDVAGQILGEAFAIDSQWKKGSYTARTFAGGVARDQSLAPRPAGESTAVDLPVPVLFASGGALQPAVLARWGDQKGNAAKGNEYRFAPALQPTNEVKVPDLWYPRLAMLGFSRTVPARPGEGRLLETHVEDPQTAVTALELVLSREDVAALAPQASTTLVSRMPDVAAAADAYARQDPQLTLSYANALVPLGQRQLPFLMGFDSSGTCYALRVRPGAWLMSSPSRR